MTPRRQPHVRQAHVRQPEPSEAGETLVEILLALVVLGVASLAILLAFTTSIIGSSEYRSVATADTVLRTAAEQATNLIQQAPAASWTACSDANLTSGQFSLPSGYTAQVASVTYWNAASGAFGSTCVPSAAQLVMVKVTHLSHSYSISFVVEDPQSSPPSSSGAAAQLVFIGQPGSTITGSPISPAPAVAVEDAHGNIVTSDLSPVSITIAPGTGTSGATLSSNCSGVEFYGVVTFSNCSVVSIGTGYKLTASDGSLPTVTSSSFDVDAAPASQFVFTKVPTGAQAASSNATIGAYQVQEQDLYGDPVVATSPVTVQLATTSTGTAAGAPFFALAQGSGSGAATTSVTIPAGSSTSPSVFYSDTAAGTPTLTASGGTLLAASTTTTVTAGQASQVALTTPPPTSTSVHTTFGVVVTEQDAFGNTVTTDSSSPVGLSASGGGALGCLGTPTRFTNGVASFTSCSVSVVATYTVTASSAGLTPATAPLVATPAAAQKLAFTTPPPASTTTGAPFPVVVAEQDAYGNTESADSSSHVSLSAPGGLACATSPSQLTAGVAAFAGCSFTSPGSSPYTVTATSGALSPATAQVRVLGPPVRLTYGATPPGTVATGAPFAFTVVEQDAAGNTETGDSTTAITPSAGGGLACSVAPSHLTAGTASFSGCTFATPALTAYTLTTSSGSLTPATAPVHAIGPPVRLVYAPPPPGSTTAGTPFSLTVTEQDAVGNTDTLDSSGSVSVGATGGGALGCTGSPNRLSSGTATFSGCTLTVASGYTVTTSTPGDAPATASVSVAPGAAHQLVYLAAPPASTLAGTGFAVTVAEQDAYGNVETGDSATALALAAGGGFTCTTSPSHVTAGLAGFSGCSFTTTGTFAVAASSFGLTPASASSSVAPGPAKRLAYATAPPATVAAGTTFQVVVVEQDAFSNTETGDSSTALSLSSGAGFACTGTPSHVINGTASFTGCSFTTAGPGAIGTTASAASLTPATATTTVSPGAAQRLAFTLLPPASVTAGTTFSVTVAEQDALGNVETADSATVLSLSGGGLGCATTPAHVMNGVASYTGCALTHAGTWTISATSAGLLTATATTTVLHAAPHGIAFATGSQTFERGAGAGTGSGTITLQAQDAYGNPVPAPPGGTSVALSSSSAGGSFTPGGTVTIPSGTSSVGVVYHDTASGAPTLTATAASLPSPTATQTETVLNGSTLTTVGVSASTPGTVTAGGTATYTVTVTYTQTHSSRDYELTSVGGLPAGASWSVTSPTCATITSHGNAGTASFTLDVPTSATTPNGASTLAVVATGYNSSNGTCSNGVAATGQGGGALAVAAPGTQLTFGQGPTNTAHGATMSPAVTVQLVDASYCVATGSTATVTVGLGSNPANATLSGPTTLTTTNGVATFAGLRVSAAGTGDTLVATSNGMNGATSAAFNVS